MEITFSSNQLFSSGQFSGVEMRKLAILICIVPFLMGLGIDMYVPSLPAITHYYHTQQNLVEYSISTYMLGYALGQAFVGVLSDCYGRKRFLIVSALLFFFTSLFISFLSPNIEIFNLWRALQGLSIGGLAVLMRAVLVDVFAGDKLYKYTNYFSISWSLGPIVGPFIGGYLQHYLGWRSDFYFFSLYALVILALVLSHVPETNRYVDKRTLNYSLAGLKTVLLDKMFLTIVLISGLVYAVCIIFNTLGPFIIQEQLKYSPVAYGNFALLLGGSYFFGVISNRILLPRLTVNYLMGWSLNISAIFSILLLFILNTKVNIYTLIIPIAAIYYITGFISPNATLKCLSLFKHLSGITSSIYGTINGLIVSLCSYLISLLNIRSDSVIAYSYLFIFVISCLLFYLIKRWEKTQLN